MATFNQPTALPTPTDDYYSSFSNKIHHTHSFSSTTGTPSAQSPTSPRTVSSSPNQSFQHAAFKHDQLRKPKTPLYIPAVLRPTEFHSSCGRFNTSAPSTSAGLKTSNSSAAVTAKNNPAGLLTPPSSAGTSFDSQDGSLAAKMMAQQSSVVGFGDDYKTFLNRMVSDEWNEDMMEEVTGAPTQDHWKPDSSSPKCDLTDCDARFGLMKRRHHCRRCGNVFCSSHTGYLVPLDQHARFHPDGVMSRACERCISDFRHWNKARSHRGSNSSGTATPTGDSTGGSILNGVPGARPIAKRREREQKEVAASGPKDWNWSTF